MPLILPSSYAQWEMCIDQDENYLEYKIIPFNAPTNVSLLIQQGYLKPGPQPPSQKLIIQKNLIFDIDYSFTTGSKLIFIPYGGICKIEVLQNKNLTIYGSIIRGCLSMWAGIKVNQGASLTIDRSSVTDAVNAVEISGNCNISLTSNIFRKNLNSIFIDFNGPLSPTISSNDFYYGPLLNNNNSTKDQKAIYLKNVDQLSIVNENRYYDYRNNNSGYPYFKPHSSAIYSQNSDSLVFENQKFNNCENGILIENEDIKTNLDIQSCNFTSCPDIELNIALGATNDVHVDKGNDVHIANCTIVNGAKVYDSNYFNFHNNYSIGVRRTVSLTNVTSSTIEYNNMHTSFGIRAKNCHYINIHDNKIYPYPISFVNDDPDFEAGIRIMGEKGTTGQVVNNNIYTSGKALENIQGIGCYLLNGRNLSIENNNIINNTRFNYFEGIGLQYSTGVNIKNNFIETFSIDNLSNFGFVLNNFANNNTITNNIINAANDINTTGLVSAAGIYPENAPSNTIFGNKITNFPLSLYFNQNCDNTNLGCNFLSNYRNAINLGNIGSYADLPTVIGIQKYKFNEFLDNAPIDFEIKAYEQTSALNTFIINTNQGVYWPNPVFPEQTRKFLPANILEYPCNFELQNPDKKYEDLTEVMKKIIEGVTIPELGGPMPPAVKWNYEWTTVDVLHDNPQILQENSDAANYYNESMNDPLGQLYLVDNFVYNTLSDMSEGRYVAIQNAINSMNSIICSHVYELNMKSVLQIILENLLTEQSDLTISQKTLLLSIANQCSNEGGRGVNIARVMLGNPELYKGYDNTICEKIIPRDCSDKNDQFKVSPNPGTGVFNFKIPSKFDYASVTVFDLKGMKVYSKSLYKDENHFTIDISDLETGIYLVEIITDNKDIYRHKLVLMK